MSMNKCQRYVAVISFAVFMLSGCAGHTWLAIGDIPLTPAEYLAHVKENRSSEKRVVNMDFDTLVRKMKKVSEQCYQYEFSEIERGVFSSKENYRERWKSRVTMLGQGHAIFTMQAKGIRNSEVVSLKGDVKVPEDGMWLYSVDAYKNGSETVAYLYYPWGWGTPTHGVLDTVEGKYGDGCPPKDVIHPGVD